MKHALSNNINLFRLDTPQEILVVFTDLPKSSGRFYGLKAGFGHCFMLLRFADNQWWVIDPLFNGIVHARLQLADSQEGGEGGEGLSKKQLLHLLESKNCRVITVQPMAKPQFGRSRIGFQTAMVSFGVFSCVTLIKRSLGIRRPWIITPFQLFCFFNRTKVEKNS